MAARFHLPSLLQQVSALVLGLSIVAGSQALAQGSKSPGRAASAASVDSGGPGWEQLTREQRTALAPLARDWHSIDGPRRAKWLEVASRFPRMQAEEQQRLQARMSEWARLSPSERASARLSFQETKQISREEKQARWEAYQALPPEQRQALADRHRPLAAQRPAATASRPAIAIDAAVPKQNLVPRPAASAPLVKPVAPIVVQAKPGATTTLMTQTPTPPVHQQPGQPKIAARPTQVDRSTLLPKTGPQAAASAPSPGVQH